ncbi:hypothetical protein, partial [Klebsiella pneumoniae]|uniref:hypothetical protein n=1 Tax=Klebsiella pneumoniae TaxID=573 RepID=UPI001EEAC53C
ISYLEIQLLSGVSGGYINAKCEAGNDGHYRVSRVKVEMGSQRTPRRCIYFRNPPFPVRNLLV